MNDPPFDRPTSTPPGSITSTTIVLLASYFLLFVLEIVNDVWQSRLLAQAANGAPINVETRQLAALADSVVLLGNIILLPMTVAAFCFWFYEAVRYARDLNSGIHVPRPGWAVGCYFIPVVSLWVPFRAMVRAWNATSLAGDEHLGAPTLVFAWWVTLLLSGLLHYMPLHPMMMQSLSGAPAPNTGYQISPNAFVFANAFGAASAVFGLLVVKKLTSAQNRIQDDLFSGNGRSRGRVSDTEPTEGVAGLPTD